MNGPVLNQWQLRQEIERERRELAVLIFSAGERAGIAQAMRSANRYAGVALCVGFVAGVVVSVSMAGFFN